MLINLVQQKPSFEVLEGKIVELEEMRVLPPEKWVSERRCLFSLNQAVPRPSAQLHSKCWKVVSEDIDDLVDAFDACQVLHVQEFGDLDKVVRRHIPVIEILVNFVVDLIKVLFEHIRIQKILF